MEHQQIKELRFALGRAEHVARKRPRASSDGSDDSDDSEVVVRLVELIEALEQAEDDADLHYGLFIWPCARVLANFVAFHNASRFRGRTVLELGCGIALPGILAALCGNTKKVILSDRADSENIKRNVLENIELNGVAHVASYLPLNWGGFDLLDHLDTLQEVDIILAADCFYRSRDFDKVMVTVAMIFRLNPNATFITAYQLRSMSHTIAPLLARYKMTARAIDKEDFMDVEAEPSADSVFVYEITPLTA